MQKERLDVFLALRGYVKSRQTAKNLIEGGLVSVDGKKILKPSFPVSEENSVVVFEKPKYVGRGGYKLEKALDVFSVNAADKICLDVGASTGGFTDCLLQNGAKRVFAVDVGHGQLDGSLINDTRIVNLENTHIKDLTKEMLENFPIGIITVDVSFISLEKVIPHLKEFMTDSTDLICLFKPQFEVGKTNKGIVRNKKDHIAALKRFYAFTGSENLYICGADTSPIKGGDGNAEFLFYIKTADSGFTPDFSTLVEKIHSAGR